MQGAEGKDEGSIPEYVTKGRTPRATPQVAYYETQHSSIELYNEVFAKSRYVRKFPETVAPLRKKREFYWNEAKYYI